MNYYAFGSPGRYLQGPGIAALLPALLTEFSAKRPMLVADDFVRPLIEKAIPALSTAFPNAFWARF